jgi:hypothetical protein
MAMLGFNPTYKSRLHKVFLWHPGILAFYLDPDKYLAFSSASYILLRWARDS